MFRFLPCLLQAVVAIHGQGHVSVVIDASASTSTKLSNVGPESSHLVRREQHVAALEPTRRLTYMALGATGLVGYLVFLASTSSASKEAQPEDRSLLGAWPTALQWMMLSMTLSIFNKWIFIPEGANFPFPMTLSCCHMLATGLLLHLLRWARPQFFPGLQGFADEPDERRRKLAKVVLLVGALLSISVVLSNSAAVLLSVAFVNMLKSGNPVLALLLGLSLGTSSCKWQMLCPLLMMMLGVLATIHGELFLSYLGLALLVMAILIEQFRLVIFKSLMSDSGFSLDPLSAVALFSPVAFIFTAAAATSEWHSSPSPGRMDVIQGSALALNSLVAVTLNIAYSRLLKVASPVTFTVFGTAKDVATAGLSLTLVGGLVTTQQLCGYVTALLGMIYYDRVKRNA
mmetsp:Transcript_37726/g.62184  ORF Transcript_37726/g.62184 Transcript_37726/m.62184 type:complete len:401 (-) Transcript_37726:78-1280(-)